MKPADELRAATGFDPIGIEQSAQKAAALLDECERVLALELDHVTRRVHSPEIARESVIRATVAKLRGQA